MDKLPVLAGLSKKVHPLAAGIGTFFLAYFAFNPIFMSLQNKNIQNMIENQPMPYWKTMNHVLNVDRTFF